MEINVILQNFIFHLWYFVIFHYEYIDLQKKNNLLGSTNHKDRPFHRYQDGDHLSERITEFGASAREVYEKVNVISTTTSTNKNVIIETCSCRSQSSRFAPRSREVGISRRNRPSLFPHVPNCSLRISRSIKSESSTLGPF